MRVIRSKPGAMDLTMTAKVDRHFLDRVESWQRRNQHPSLAAAVRALITIALEKDENDRTRNRP